MGGMGEIQECPSVASGAFYYLLRSRYPRYLGTLGDTSYLIIWQT